MFWVYKFSTSLFDLENSTFVLKDCPFLLLFRVSKRAFKPCFRQELTARMQVISWSCLRYKWISLICPDLKYGRFATEWIAFTGSHCHGLVWAGIRFTIIHTSLSNCEVSMRLWQVKQQGAHCPRPALSLHSIAVYRTWISLRHLGSHLATKVGTGTIDIQYSYFDLYIHLYLINPLYIFTHGEWVDISIYSKPLFMKRSTERWEKMKFHIESESDSIKDLYFRIWKPDQLIICI